ncbi:uncharacterized protein LOC105183878 [Harpegnathos saltator]|uniref:28S ribosomal protein S34, mitochondrial n=1 Tax=Harpegnathos saltator TaxID=610380 RepID=E2BKK1_HARSA|nr:uncharacterized protein LOC105183878 [Harpegnathos saltator]EFN83788.1 28S ribosomal protein S34, mitochondrial [Harpegnathos saltator]
MPIKLIGRTTYLKGKPLWEILGNLKNFGVGRLVIRNCFQRYPEACYMKILKVAAMPASTEPYKDRNVIALVDEVFRGRKNSKPTQYDLSTYKPDFMLVPKDQEHLYLERTVMPVKKVVPRTMEFPPLFTEMLMHQMRANGIAKSEKPQLTLHYNDSRLDIKNYRIAEEDEAPTMKFDLGMDKSSVLYPKEKATEPL